MPIEYWYRLPQPSHVKLSINDAAEEPNHEPASSDGDIEPGSNDTSNNHVNRIAKHLNGSGAK